MLTYTWGNNKLTLKTLDSLRLGAITTPATNVSSPNKVVRSFEAKRREEELTEINKKKSVDERRRDAIELRREQMERCGLPTNCVLIVCCCMLPCTVLALLSACLSLRLSVPRAVLKELPPSTHPGSQL